MRAFIFRINPMTGRDMLGTEHNQVSNEYKSFSTFKRYCLGNLTPGYQYHVELFNNWDNRYGTPTRDFIHDARPKKACAICRTQFVITSSPNSEYQHICPECIKSMNQTIANVTLTQTS